MPAAISACDVAETTGSGYPAPHDAAVSQRSCRRLVQAFGLTQFGVNITRLPPGVWSSQRHWHALEDEFVYVLSGEVVMVTDAGEQLCLAGDCVGFKAGDPDGHHFINRSSDESLLLCIGSYIDGDHGEYPDIDMLFSPRKYDGNTVVPVMPGVGYLHKDGTPFETQAAPAR